MDTLCVFPERAEVQSGRVARVVRRDGAGGGVLGDDDVRVGRRGAHAGADAVRVDRGDDSRERRVRGGNPGVGGAMRRVARRARRGRGGDRRSRRT